MTVTEKTRSTRRRTWCQTGFGAEWKKKIGRADQEGWTRLKIFTLNRKDWLLISEWLWLGHNDNVEKYNICNIVRPLPDIRDPVICTGFHPSRRHRWCTVTFRLSPVNLYSTKCSRLILSFRGRTRSISSSNSKDSLTYELRIKDYRRKIKE
jgi:hypothetical protein